MRPTITDVAKRANTTVATVSRVINNSAYVSPGIRSQVEAAIKELAYIPNVYARSLKTNKSTTLGVVLRKFNHLSSMGMASGIHALASQNGLQTFITEANGAEGGEGLAIEAFHGQRVAGIVVGTGVTNGTHHVIDRIVAQQTPIVLMGAATENPNVDWVTIDLRSGGEMATQHLIQLGHQQIAFLGADLKSAPSIPQLQGYLDALTSVGRPVVEEDVVGDPSQSSSDSSDVFGYRAASQVLRRSNPPTAIFARNDYVAFGVIQAARELGLRIPHDLSVVGFGDTPLAAEVAPALTTVREPFDLQGKKAAEIILSRIRTPDEFQRPCQVTLNCELIRRHSTQALIATS